MIKFVRDGSSIECLSAEVISRKPVPSSFMKIKEFRCQSYKCYRNSEAVIFKELKEKTPIYNYNSCIKNGAKLECENLFLAVNTLKRLKFKKCTHTGRHKSQIVLTKNYTYASIIKQIPNLDRKLEAVEIKLIE